MNALVFHIMIIKSVKIEGLVDILNVLLKS